MRLRTAIVTGISGVFALVAVGVIIVSRIDANGYYRSTIINKVEQETGRKLVLGGELKLSFLPAPALTVKDIALSNPPWAPAPQMVTIGQLSAQVALLPLIFGGKLRINRLDLKDVNLRLATDAHGRGNWETGTGKPDSAAPAPIDQAAPPLDLPTFGEVTLENIVITYDDGQSRKSATLSLAHLALSGSSESPINIKASAAYQGLPIELNATVGAMSSLMASKQPYPISADILAAGATLKISGSVDEPLSARGVNCAITVDGPNLSLIGKSFGISLPEKPYHLAATVTGDVDGKITLKALQSSVGSSKISGNVTVSTNGARPKINAVLDAAMIDLTEFPQGQSVRRSEQDDRIFSKEKLPLAALSTIDADLALTADEVKSDGPLLKKLSMHLILEDRDLRVKTLAFNLGEGHVGGEIDFLARQSPPVLVADITGRDLDFGTLLTQLSGYDLLEGRGSLALAAHGSGESIRAIMATLDGSSSLIMGRGLIKSRYADLIGADVFREAFAWTQGKKDSKLTCMVSRFDYRSGLGTSRDLLVDTSDVTIIGSGTVNLGSERLDLELLPRPKETSLLSLAVPIDIGGSLAHPSVQTNRVAMAKDAVKGIVTWINPLYALIPMVLNAGQDTNPCITMLQAKSTATLKNGKASPDNNDSGIGGFMRDAGSAIGSVFK